MAHEPAVSRTKLIPPLAAADAVFPEGLVGRVTARTLRAAVTVVRGDGGAGKTTLARAVVEHAEVPTGWISFDPTDDLASTVSLIGTVLRQLIDIEPPTPPAGPGAAHEVAAALANAIVDAEAGDVLVVLDDLHELTDRGALDALTHLARLGPAGLHLLVTTRHRVAGLPDARSIALGTADEIEPELLRVAPDRAVAIARSMGRELEADAAARLVERTGGWVLGVRLLASHDPGAAPPGDLLRRYVHEEVLARQPSEVVAGLEVASVVDVLTPEAVRGLLDVPDPVGWIRHVRSELPLLTSSDAEGALRLHALLRDLLREGLATDPVRWRSAHLAAAEVATTWTERFEHLLFADATGAAADLLDAEARVAFPRPAPLQRVADRIDRLPDDVVAGRPWLRVILGVCLVQRHVADEALRWLLPALEELGSGDDAAEDLLARWAATRYAQVVAADTRTWSTRLLALEQEAAFGRLPPAVLAEHHLGLAHAAFFAGRDDEVAARHDAATAVARHTRDAGAIGALAQHTSPMLAQVDGGVERIRAWVTWVDGARATETALATFARHVQAALVSLADGDPERALAAVLQASPLRDRVDAAFVEATLDWVLVSVWTARGDLAPAADLAERGLRAPGQLAPGWAVPLARIRAELGDADGVRALTAIDASGGGPTAGVTAIVPLLVRAELARLEGDPDGAVAMLEQAEAHSAGFRIVPSIGRVGLDRVVALDAAGRHDDALRLLLDELVLLDQMGWLGVVACRGRVLVPVLERAVASGFQVQAARRCLAVLAPPAGPAAVELPDGGALSPREVEVLRLVAIGRSNREIAEELTLSVNTIKTHVRNVLAKLDVPTRAAAAAAATGLGIGQP